MCFSSSVPHNWSSWVLTHCFPPLCQEVSHAALGEGWCFQISTIFSNVSKLVSPPRPHFFFLLLLLLFLLQWSAKISIWEGWTYYYYFFKGPLIHFVYLKQHSLGFLQPRLKWSPFARSCWFHNLQGYLSANSYVELSLVPWHMVLDLTTSTEVLLFTDGCQSLAVEKAAQIGAASYVAMQLISLTIFSKKFYLQKQLLARKLQFADPCYR